MEHHAYVYVAQAQDDLPETIVRPGTDVEHVELDRLSIADVRTIKASAYRRPQEHALQHIVIKAQAIPHEAQNALLKLLEEPPATTVLHLCVPFKDQLLPTVLSRVALVERAETRHEPSTVFADFVSASLQERMAQIEKAHKQKDTVFFRGIARGAEQYLDVEHPPADVRREVLFIITTIDAPGASKKMLAEHLALTLSYQG